MSSPSPSTCPYANLFGTPGSGFHAWRLGPIAAGDTLATILVAFLTSYFFNTALWKSLIGWFLAGEIAHWIFGTRTAVLIGLGLERRC
jgi:hypothetical protein